MIHVPHDYLIKIRNYIYIYSFVDNTSVLFDYLLSLQILTFKKCKVTQPRRFAPDMATRHQKVRPIT